jgi:hypothetical protein
VGFLHTSAIHVLTFRALLAEVAPDAIDVQLEECAVGAGAVIIDAPCLDAWPLFEAGDQAGYLARIAGHARTLDADVIVLAQASMASATELLDDLRIPVLSSPRLGVLRAVEMAGGR